MNEKLNVPQTPEDLFKFIDSNSIASEKIVAPRYSYWKSVFRVFFRKKVNYFLLGMLGLLLVFSFVMPNFWHYDPNENVLDASSFNLSPAKALKHFNNGAFSFKWCLGTGALGNSIFYGIVASARTSLLLAIIVASINMTIGLLIGAVWGYVKKLDLFLLTLFNIIANVPDILLLTVLVYVIGNGFWSFIFAMTVTGWLGIAYFFRNQVMIIRDREYSLASRCLGTPVRRIVSKNVLPFMVSVIVTILATSLPGVISAEVTLSFLGLGMSASVPSLGRMIQAGQTAFMTYPWAFWPPVAVSAMLTIILYLLGQSLGDASDPRTHM